MVQARRKFDRKNLTELQWAEVVRRLRYGLFLVNRVFAPSDFDWEGRYDVALDAVVDAVLYFDPARPGANFGALLKFTVRRRLEFARGLRTGKHRAHAGPRFVRGDDPGRDGPAPEPAGREMSPAWHLELAESLAKPGEAFTRVRSPAYRKERVSWSMRLGDRQYSFGKGIPADEHPQVKGIPVRAWRAMAERFDELTASGTIDVGGRRGPPSDRKRGSDVRILASRYGKKVVDEGNTGEGHMRVGPRVSRNSDPIPYPKPLRKSEGTAAGDRAYAAAVCAAVATPERVHAIQLLGAGAREPGELAAALGPDGPAAVAALLDSGLVRGGEGGVLALTPAGRMAWTATRALLS